MATPTARFTSLEASNLTDKVRRLVLYKPPIPIDGPVYPPGVPERIQALVDVGDPEAALEVFFREVVRMPDREFEVFRTLPTWKIRITLAPTIPRELTIERSYRFRPERFAQFSIPTLLLLGGESPPVFGQTIEWSALRCRPVESWSCPATARGDGHRTRAVSEGGDRIPERPSRGGWRRSHATQSPTLLTG